MSARTTNRTSGLSMPMPKALVGANHLDAVVEELPLGLQLSLGAHPRVEVARRHSVHVQVLLRSPQPAACWPGRLWRRRRCC